MDIRKNRQSLALSLTFVLVHLLSTAQCKSKHTFGSFVVKLPKKFNVSQPSESIQQEMTYFKAIVKSGQDSVLVFEDNELYTQAILEIDQDIFSLTGPEAFDLQEGSVTSLEESRDLRFAITENRLIIADYGPKSSETTTQHGFELFCYDFKSKRTLVIISSSSPTEWNNNLQEIATSFADKLFAATKKSL